MQNTTIPPTNSTLGGIELFSESGSLLSFDLRFHKASSKNTISSTRIATPIAASKTPKTTPTMSSGPAGCDDGVVWGSQLNINFNTDTLHLSCLIRTKTNSIVCKSVTQAQHRPIPVLNSLTPAVTPWANSNASKQNSTSKLKLFHIHIACRWVASTHWADLFSATALGRRSKKTLTFSWSMPVVELASVL